MGVLPQGDAVKSEENDTFEVRKSKQTRDEKRKRREEEEEDDGGVRNRARVVSSARRVRRRYANTKSASF